MRRLLRICASLCAGMALGLLPVPKPAGLGMAGLLLVMGLIALLRARLRSAALVLLPLSLGIGWSLGYDLLVVQPAKAYAGSTQIISGYAQDYSQPGSSGQWVSLRCPSHGLPVSVDLYLRDYDDTVAPGDLITVEAKLSGSASGGDYYSYSQGVYLRAYGTSAPEVVSRGVSLRYLSRYIAHALEQSVAACFPADVLGYASALTTGNRTGLTLAEKTTLQQSGIYHTLALSGMHMAVLVGLLPLLKKSRHRAMVGIPLCIGFTLVTGCSPSMVRACVMECALLLDRALSRESDWATTLSLSGVLLMAENPWCILNWGLQLSFLSVLGIHLLAYPLCKRNLAPGRICRKSKLLTAVVQNLSVSLSAVVFTVPLMSLYFGAVSLISPITNLLTGPVVSLCFGLSLPAGLIGIFAPGVGQVLGWVVAWGYRYVMAVADLMAHTPFACIYTATDYGVLCVALVYLMLLALVFGKAGAHRRMFLSGGVMALIICLVLLLSDATSPAFSALDVGQGQSLTARGIRRIRLLILTHYDEDHAGGVPELLARMPVDVILMPDVPDEHRDAIEAAALQSGTAVYPVSDSLLTTVGHAELRIYGPLSTAASGNDAGICVYAALPELSVLITGDLDSDSETQLLRTQDVPQADLLVAGHHGSKYSTSSLLLRKIAPKAVVISVGENSYGHPAQETLARIRSTGAAVLRTDELGTIRCVGTEDGVQVSCTGTD